MFLFLIKFLLNILICLILGNIDIFAVILLKTCLNFAMVKFSHQSFFKPYFIFSTLLLQKVLRQLNKVSGDNMAHLPETGLSQTSVIKTCIVVTILMLQIGTRKLIKENTYLVDFYSVRECADGS